MYKQVFTWAYKYSYSLETLGEYYIAYERLCQHWRETLGDQLIEVQYEDMVNDTESEIRRLLDHCGLDFEEQCLRFYETERAVRTPSSEQVRQPVYTQGLEQWRNFDAHLGPLKEALGPLLERYPID